MAPDPLHVDLFNTWIPVREVTYVAFCSAITTQGIAVVILTIILALNHSNKKRKP